LHTLKDRQKFIPARRDIPESARGEEGSCAWPVEHEKEVRFPEPRGNINDVYDLPAIEVQLGAPTLDEYTLIADEVTRCAKVMCAIDEHRFGDECSHGDDCK
jgi:hypothetical protein